MRKTGFSILILLCSMTMGAQDVHFSQFNFSPVNLNPALTGFFDGDYRVVANYRNQWGSVPNANSFRTISVSAEGSFLKGLLNNDYVGAGLVVVRDDAGTLNLNATHIGATLAYAKRFGYEIRHAISAGFYGAYVLQGLDLQNALFPVEPEAIGDSENYLDFGAGIMYHIVPRERLNMIIGGAYHHFHAPSNSFLGNSGATVEPKITVHTSAEIEISNNVNMLPSILFLYQDPSYQINVGTYAQFILGEAYDSETSFAIGLWSRIVRDAADAFIVGARFDYRGLTAGLSYDINMSEFSGATGNKGGFEISLLYAGRLSDRRDKGPHCPTF